MLAILDTVAAGSMFVLDAIGIVLFLNFMLGGPDTAPSPKKD